MLGKGFCYGVYDLLASLMLVLANGFAQTFLAKSFSLRVLALPNPVSANEHDLGVGP